MWWSSDSSLTLDVGSNYFLVLYFTELEDKKVGFRHFNVSVDNYSLADAFSPSFFRASVLTWTVPRSSRYVVSLIATPNSTVGPVISGMEIYMLRQQNESTTYSADANAMMTIQMKFSVKKNWVGDPCSPVFFAWDGLECRYAPSSPRIIALNLSSSGLAGEVDISVGQLQLLQYLDLSHNKLSGSIPEFLGELTSLKYLDLSNNNFSGPIPGALLEKSQNGLLALRVDNNPNLCENYTCNNKKKKITGVLEIIVPVISSVALLSVVLLVCWHRIKNRQDAARPVNPFENRNFKYNELRLITDNFSKVIGKGGFGPVYFGSLENGTPVAVKVRSETSSQGHKEFLAEAQYLARVHHKNLVSLIGYCKDKKHLSLVYEYMDGGNLEDRLKGQVPLNWLQRLNIALDCAYGLHYLHKSCGRPMIHRDVKAVKILLTADLEARISDFGLTRAFSSEMSTHATTRPMGTSGYLDPEYYATSHLSEKSDVYSFGILLLVLITAQPVIVTANNAKRENISLWVRSRLLEGDIESLTDLRIRGHYDVNSVWKVAEMALHCTEHKRQDRPTMMEVVEGLKEGLQLENSSRSSVETGRQFAVC